MNKDTSPQFSLIVPLQDEEATVEALLESIATQTFPPAEIILVDAGSRDDTARRIQMAKGQLPILLVTTQRVFPGVARNQGAQRAHGSWLAFTDGGIVLPPRWLEELARAIEPGVDAVFGDFDPVCDTFFKKCAAIAYVPGRRLGRIASPFVASSAVSRRAFDSVGGFPAYRAAEDLIFIERLRATHDCREAPGARVRWHIAGSVGSTFRRFSEYSFHNLLAGRGRSWHCGVVRSYTLLAASAGLLTALGFPHAAGAIVPLFFAARAMKGAWLKRRSFTFRTLRPSLLAGAAALLVIIDAATAAGTIRWLVAGAPRDSE